MSIHTSYHIEDVSFTIGDLEAVGNGLVEADDAIMIEADNPIGTLNMGADGSSVFSQHASRKAMITLKVQHGSPVHARLVELRRAQQNRQLDGVALRKVDRRTNEGGSCDKAFIVERAADMAGKIAGERVWKLETPYWSENDVNATVGQ